MSKVKCSHCHLEFDESAMIKDGDEFFCCNGCQGVYHLLKDDGLDSFYNKLGNKTIAPPIENDNDTSKFDLESFEKRFIRTTEDGFKQVDLIIEGIHCAACVWLNEKILYKTDGIIEANINFTNYKAKIVWDETKVKLSEIIDKIRSIGYNAYPYDATKSDEKAIKTKREYFIKMMVAVFASMNIMMLGVAKYTGFFTGMDEEVKRLVHFGEFILTTPVLFYSGWIFFKGAYYGLKNRIINMDFLVATGATLTYIYSIYILFGGIGESYFDSVTMIITFVLVGKYLEVLGKKGAIDTLDKIKSQLPNEATIIIDGTKKIVSLEEVKIGNTIELKGGEKAGIDGEVTSGSANFDESSISGESIPVYKTKGDTVFSGTVNTDNTIRYIATKDYANSTLNSIVTMIEDSLSSKPKIEEAANELSKYFSVAILLLALITFFSWYFYGGDLFYETNANRFEKAFIVMISVIVIACPCALALATPIASLVGISWLAAKGLLFKEAKFLETMAKADTLVVDKTGTITKGEFSVIYSSLPKEQKEINLLYSLVDSSTHPVSQAVKKYLENNIKELSHYNLENIENVEAKGLKADYKGQSLLGGNSALLKEFDITTDIKPTMTQFLFALNNKVVASFELEDELKDDAEHVISLLQDKGIEVIMLTGDNEQVASKIASKAGINNFVSHINPIGKSNFIKKLKDEGKTIVMAGDGINDALALSNSDIAIAMGNGADISIAVSDVVILNNSLKGLLDSFNISKRTYYFIKQNLALSLIYNAITVPLAMLGYVIPLVAALSMSLSSLLVVGNSMRIKK